MRRTTYAAGGLVLLLAVVSACADPSASSGQTSGESRAPSPSPSGADDTSTGGVAQTDGTPPGAASDVELRDDLSDLVPIGWRRVEPLDATHARIFFTGQNPECYGTSADVAETDAQVTVALSQGTLPGAPKICAALAAELSVVVTTSAPINGRDIVAPGR